MNQERKPPQRVVAIAGVLRDDVVTQAELTIVSSLQEAEWIASRAAQQAVLRVEARLQSGGKIERGKLGFDRQLRMVRSRKAGGE